MSHHSTPTHTVSHSSDAAVAKEPVPGATATRREHDSLGEMEIAAASYYGIQTQRALDNFHISGVGINHYPNLIRAFGMVKKACAAANHKLGYLAPEKYKATPHACDELLAGKLRTEERRVGKAGGQ